MSSKTRDVHVSVVISGEMNDKLAFLAEKSNASKSFVIKTLLEEKLNEVEFPRRIPRAKRIRRGPR